MARQLSDELQLSQLLNLWLKDLRLKVRPTSYEVYCCEVNNHIIPELGMMEIKELTPFTGEKLRNSLIYKGLSAQTAKDIEGKLSQALRWGVDNGYCVPILKRTSNSRNGRQIRTLTLQEQEVIRLNLPEASIHLCNSILLAWKAGLSIGEICALSWEDIDRKKGIIKVHRLCQRVRGGLTYLEEKSRCVPLPKELHIDSSDRGLFIRSIRGDKTEPRLCQIWFKHFISKLEIKDDITYAVLRNTYVKNLMENGTDFIDISRLAGYSDLNDLWKKFGVFYVGQSV